MRVTNKSVYFPYQRNLEEIQNRRFKEQMRLSTSNDIVNIADAPDRLVDVKQLSSKLSENYKYISINDDALGEMRIMADTMEAISDNLQKIRQLTIDSTQIGNSGNIYSLATYIKGIMQDTVKLANNDFQGRYIFGGTKTTKDSLDVTAEAPIKEPFELIQGEPTADNKSGLKVVFKGNNELRAYNKDAKTTEVINTASNEVFGNESTEVFDAIIQVYNLLAYNSNGEQRQLGDYMTNEEISKVSFHQQRVATLAEKLDNASGRNGAKLARVELVRDQMVEENARLNEFLSLKQDTDVAKSTINLKLEENALNYSLQVGSKLIQNSLFDFLR